MTSLIYPRYRVIIGLLITGTLMLMGVGAILSLAITPLAGDPSASLLAAIDSARVIYSIKMLHCKLHCRYWDRSVLLYRYQLPWPADEIGLACPFSFCQ